MTFDEKPRRELSAEIDNLVDGFGRMTELICQLAQRIERLESRITEQEPLRGPDAISTAGSRHGPNHDARSQ